MLWDEVLVTLWLEWEDGFCPIEVGWFRRKEHCNSAVRQLVHPGLFSSHYIGMSAWKHYPRGGQGKYLHMSVLAFSASISGLLMWSTRHRQKQELLAMPEVSCIENHVGFSKTCHGPRGPLRPILCRTDDCFPRKITTYKLQDVWTWIHRSTLGTESAPRLLSVKDFPACRYFFFETFVEMRVPQNSNNHQSIAHDVGPTW